ncbi:hypothetical protein L1987_51312 [Smallanthus sonchifolius]|uniref:Uncharacterized protein n=1 Tax=Smallanthus sonchifolius TaxID=185202 RepID=A0ACB9EQK2_9ASTR|nr:hypothetical protein L1987_51312 [Smallanthus sonchifolius]
MAIVPLHFLPRRVPVAKPIVVQLHPNPALFQDEKALRSADKWPFFKVRAADMKKVATSDVKANRLDKELNAKMVRHLTIVRFKEDGSFGIKKQRGGVNS